MSDQQSTLEEAYVICEVSRNKAYGEPIDNHSLTASLYTAYLDGRLLAGKPMVDETAVCFLNILQKISRSVFGPDEVSRDTLVDIEGYAHNIDKVQRARAERMAAQHRRASAFGGTTFGASSGPAPDQGSKSESEPKSARRSARVR